MARTMRTRVTILGLVALAAITAGRAAAAPTATATGNAPAPASVSPPAPASAPDTAITVCADPDPPPWTYRVRDAQGARTDRFEGFSVDLVRAALARLDRRATFIGHLPWARCLQSVESGSVDFAMDGYLDEDRARRFAHSVHYSTLTPQVYVRGDGSVRIASRADLARYRGCGMLGASYAHYGLRPEDLDLGVSTYDGLVRKLQARRCDYFVEELEVIAGFRMLGRDYLAGGGIVHGPVAGVAGPSKHLLTARSGRGAELLPALDRALSQLIASGEAERLWRRHAPGLAYRP